MSILEKYRFHCTLTLGDIFGQVIVWLGVVFASLAAALSLMSRPVYAIAAVGLIVVASLPFLLFAFVVTLFSHIEISPITAEEMAKERGMASRSTAARVAQAG